MYKYNLSYLLDSHSAAMHFYFTTLFSLSLKLLCRLRILRNKQLLFVTCHQWDNESTQEAEAAFLCVCVYFTNDQTNESRVNDCLASVLHSAAVVRYFDISSWLHNKIRQIFRWATETPHTLWQLCGTQKKRRMQKWNLTWRWRDCSVGLLDEC